MRQRRPPPKRIANGEESFDEAKIAAMNMVPDAYRGMDRFEARKKIVEDITGEGLAVMTQETITDAEGSRSPGWCPWWKTNPSCSPSATDPKW